MSRTKKIELLAMPLLAMGLDRWRKLRLLRATMVDWRPWIFRFSLLRCNTKQECGRQINKALASVASRLKLRRAARLTALKGFASPRLASPHPLSLNDFIVLLRCVACPSLFLLFLPLRHHYPLYSISVACLNLLRPGFHIRTHVVSCRVDMGTVG
ncbi:hypothetical protein Cgig2_006841 [Carnegiea gigantea]|uniref:Uncharacterized protein n=1 Tax=Carnegiea gigantea TaxID=171969 RepID=A0A9Q1GJW4_9CARY|nr:hypothetical protein Cgig2_006841 [Carnegiea gigantea]